MPTGVARAANLLTAACWPAAFAVFMLHVTGHVFTTARSFDETACWLVAIGCLGCPAFALRVLGRWTTARVCLGIGLAAAGASLLLTALDVGHQIDPGPSNRLIGLVLLLAIAIQSLNGAEQMARQARVVAGLKHDFAAAVDRARQEHRETCVMAVGRDERVFADLLDAAGTIPDRYARVMLRILETRLSQPAPRADDQAAPVVPLTPRVNGNR